jgi:outer membrane protein assembly factor BamB
MSAIALLLFASVWGDSWPQFRGPEASGVNERAKPPDVWNQQSFRWKTPIPGLAHSSPIVWRNQIFLTTAVSSNPAASFKHGLYGDGAASDDLSVHRWKLLCLDKRTGVVLWERTAFEGKPKEKRHIKSTYANATPATDGKRVIAFFGSQGIYAYDLSGNLLWKRDLGVLRLGAYDAPDYEWGTASSPILHHDMVIVQCDTQGRESFVIALDAATGATRWKTAREELPSWGTPSVANGELITNGSKAIRGYDPATGKELWSFGGSSKITAPTPVFANGIAIVASGRRPEAPIFAVRLGSGDHSPGASSSGAPTCRLRSSSMVAFTY